MARSFPQRLKMDGNLNRIDQLHEAGCTALEMQACFALGGLNLYVSQGDIPLLRNGPELSRKALPKAVVRGFLSGRNGPVPA